MRTPLVAANWKMFKTVHEAVVYTKELRGLVKDVDDVEVVVAPPFTAVHAVAEAARNTNVGVAGQDLFWEREGAFTGEISAGMLKEAGAGYVIIGHSERRTKFGETDEAVNRKLLAALGAELTPLVCIGETLGEREANRTFEVLDRQIREGLAGLRSEQIEALAMAYEPVWAIGTGRNASPALAEEAHAHIRSRIGEWIGEAAAAACRIMYGGSVKLENVRDLVAQPDVDGALVGGASLDVAVFAKLVAASRPGRI